MTIPQRQPGDLHSVRHATAVPDTDGGLRVVPGANLACECGDTIDILGIEPGYDAETLDDVLGALGRPVVIARGVAVRAWCCVCWRRKFGKVAA